jgi:2-dehydro-3-deoxy-D-arabinonate dehydratase
MKICRFWRPGAGPAIGLVKEDRVHDLTALDPSAFGSLSSLLCSGDLDARLAACAQRCSSSEGVPFSDLDVPPDRARPHLLAPLTSQEVWAAGVTYVRSRDARVEESAGGRSFYEKVYTADRPELFFKATPGRVAGPNAEIRIRADSRWTVPEPELALVINAAGALVGYTIGNDVSSRDIEGENPLYLPQAKVYVGCCALGPAVVLDSAAPHIRTTTIRLVVRRRGEIFFDGSTTVGNMKRSFAELVAYLFREQQFPNGVILLTGTGVVPPDDFALQPGDQVDISIPEIGTLRNVAA